MGGWGIYLYTYTIHYIQVYSINIVQSMKVMFIMRSWSSFFFHFYKVNRKVRRDTNTEVKHPKVQVLTEVVLEKRSYSSFKLDIGPIRMKLTAKGDEFSRLSPSSSGHHERTKQVYRTQEVSKFSDIKTKIKSGCLSHGHPGVLFSEIRFS